MAEGQQGTLPPSKELPWHRLQQAERGKTESIDHGNAFQRRGTTQAHNPRASGGGLHEYSLDEEVELPATIYSGTGGSYKPKYLTISVVQHSQERGRCSLDVSRHVHSVDGDFLDIPVILSKPPKGVNARVNPMIHLTARVINDVPSGPPSSPPSSAQLSEGTEFQEARSAAPTISEDGRASFATAAHAHVEEDYFESEDAQELFESAAEEALIHVAPRRPLAWAGRFAMAVGKIRDERIACRLAGAMLSQARAETSAAGLAKAAENIACSRPAVKWRSLSKAMQSAEREIAEKASRVAVDAIGRKGNARKHRVVASFTDLLGDREETWHGLGRACRLRMAARAYTLYDDRCARALLSTETGFEEAAAAKMAATEVAEWGRVEGVMDNAMERTRAAADVCMIEQGTLANDRLARESVLAPLTQSMRELAMARIRSHHFGVDDYHQVGWQEGKDEPNFEYEPPSAKGWDPPLEDLSLGELEALEKPLPGVIGELPRRFNLLRNAGLTSRDSH